MYSYNTFSPNLVSIGRQIEFSSPSPPPLVITTRRDNQNRQNRNIASRYFAASFNRLLYQQLQCGSILREKRSALSLHTQREQERRYKERDRDAFISTCTACFSVTPRSNPVQKSITATRRTKFGKKSPLFFLSTPFIPNKLAFERDQWKVFLNVTFNSRLL